MSQQSIIERLANIESNSFFVACIKEWIEKGLDQEELIFQIQSQAKDSPTSVKRMLGEELFNDIENYVLCWL